MRQSNSTPTGAILIPPTLANERVKLRKWVQELLLPIDILLKSPPPQSPPASVAQ